MRALHNAGTLLKRRAKSRTQGQAGLPLTALLIIDDADCAFTVLGVPIVEFQLRQAIAAGAGHAVLMVGRMPPSLHGTIDRLRREGLGIDVARAVADAVDFVHPDDRVLLVAPRVAIAPDDIRALGGGMSGSALAVPPTTEAARLDIIDGGRRWTGWAAFDGRFLREVGATIGDWDLAPTILRKLLQAGAETPMVSAPVALLERSDDRRTLEAGLRNQADIAPDGVGDALVVQPAARLAAQMAGDAAVRPEWVGWAGFAAALAAVALGIAGWIALPAAMMLVALCGWRTEAIMTAALAARPARANPLEWARAMLVGVLLITVGVTAMHASGQWGCVVLALVLTAALALLRTPLVRTQNPLVLADPASSLAIIGVASLFAAPIAGLAIAVIHATATVAIRQYPVPQSQT